MMNEDRYAEQLVARLREWMESGDHIKARHRSSARDACYSPQVESIRSVLPPGVEQLYTHQHQVLALALGGQHVTVATATASGKTYAMALPARVKRQRDVEATLLCVAPTRALVEQWKERLQIWNPSVAVETFTGDTPKAERALVRDRVQYLIITPDMLHLSLLPNHPRWQRYLTHLQDVIIDESHTYKGVFGSHFSLILRRLRRIVALYRATQPTYLFGSATIGNPAGHAEQLLGLPVTPVTESGAPSGGRLTLLWQPPDAHSYIDEAAGLMAFFVRQGVRTILFGQNRQSVEKMLRHAQRLLPAAVREKVVAYRAGYSKEQRRRIEQQLAGGDLLGIVSTSALEIGIDLGDLDVSIVAGFPGSISSYFQQVGRAGRRHRSALSILILREDALDQYFASHPTQLLESSAENALVNANNPFIFPAHLLLAAAEYPLSAADFPLFGLATSEMIETLVQQRKLYQWDGMYRLTDRRYGAAFQVPLRQVGQRLAIEAFSGEQVEEIDIHHAVSECYPGAIYFSQGVSYQVQQLDITQGIVKVRQREYPYYTQALTETAVAIQQSMRSRHCKHVDLHTGRVIITRIVEGYVKRYTGNHTLMETHGLEETLSVELDTKAVWMVIPDLVIEALQLKGYDPAGALHAVEHSMIALLPLFVLGDRRDVGGVSIVPAHPQTNAATIFIYDGYPGGVGYSDEAYQQWQALARATLDMLSACTCTHGCYSCIFSPKCGNQNRPLDKAGAIALLQSMLES
ncbi:helicase [Ktedonobacteria bacterium brp13]|nr:helicase [Ktedonobacteria bacterium brp13]